MNHTLEQLLAALPEKYQPIFGHPEMSEDASRACEDRLLIIRETYDSLQSILSRPLRVLDLGCAQGYFSLSLAAAGAEVIGVDYLPENVMVCGALAKENPNINAKFQIGRIEEILEQMQPGDFDLILGLSVFHHVIHENGIPAVKRLLEISAERAGFLLLELALKGEQLYWAPSQPDDPQELLEGIAFSHQLARCPTHLTDIKRPIFAASNRYWSLNGFAQKILSWTTEPHQLAQGTHQGSRRYYISEKHILKLNRIVHTRGEHNHAEYLREIDFLKKSPSGFAVPYLHCYGENENETWVVLERLQGQLLSELLIADAEIDIQKVLRSVINQVCVLESAGWYHNDIRSWNTLIQKDGSVVLIDYGSMQRHPTDCAWPNNIFLAFLIFVYEVTTRHRAPPIPLRAVAMSSGRFPAPYDILVRRLWEVPIGQWSFYVIKEIFEKMSPSTSTSTSTSRSTRTSARAIDAWSTAIEDAIQILSLNQHQLSLEAQQTNRKADQSEAKAQAAVSQSDLAETKAQQAQSKADQAEAQAQQAMSKTDQADAQAKQAQSKADHAEAQAQQAMSKADQAEAQARQAQSRAAQADAQAQQAQCKADQAEAQARQAEAQARQAEAQARQAEAQARQAESAASRTLMQLDAIYASTSWRITTPLRAGYRLAFGDKSSAPKFALNLHSALTFIPSRTHRLLKDPIGHAIRYVARRPGLKDRLLLVISRIPSLERWLIEKRTAQLREDFLSTAMFSSEGSVHLHAQGKAQLGQMSIQEGHRSVDEILDLIRVELQQNKGL